MAQSVVLESRHVHQLGQYQVWLGPNLLDLVLSREELLSHFVLGHVRIPDRVGEQGDGTRDGGVEGGGLVHHGLSRGGALDVSAQVFHLLQYLVGCVLGC